MIAALSENNVIANDDGIPWDIPRDMEHYKETVSGNLTVCGRKTYESIPVVPGRECVVITRQEDYDTDSDEAYVANSIDEATEIANNICNDDEVVYIAGGESIYSEFLGKADRMVLSHIYGEYEGDIEFPKFDKGNWSVEDQSLYEEFEIKWYQRVNSK